MWLRQSQKLSLVNFMVLTNVTPMDKLFDLSHNSLLIKIWLDSLKWLHESFMCASMKLLDNIMWEVKSKWKKNTFLIQHKSVHNLLWPNDFTYLNSISSIEEVALGSSLMTSTQWGTRLENAEIDLTTCSASWHFDMASTTILSPPFLYSMLKSNPINLHSQHCWTTMVLFWIHRCFKLWSSVRTTNFLSNR